MDIKHLKQSFFKTLVVIIITFNSITRLYQQLGKATSLSVFLLKSFITIFVKIIRSQQLTRYVEFLNTILFCRVQKSFDTCNIQLISSQLSIPITASIKVFGDSKVFCCNQFLTSAFVCDTTKMEILLAYRIQ